MLNYVENKAFDVFNFEDYHYNDLFVYKNKRVWKLVLYNRYFNVLQTHTNFVSLARMFLTYEVIY